MMMLLALLALTAPVQDGSPPEAPHTATKLVPINPQSWVTAKDYPSTSRNAGHTGIVGFRLDVDATGTVTKCTVISSSGHALLDHKTCSVLMQRARFQPALDGNGQPMPATWSSRFSWGT